MKVPVMNSFEFVRRLQKEICKRGKLPRENRVPEVLLYLSKALLDGRVDGGWRELRLDVDPEHRCQGLQASGQVVAVVAVVVIVAVVLIVVVVVVVVVVSYFDYLPEASVVIELPDVTADDVAEDDDVLQLRHDRLPHYVGEHLHHRTYCQNTILNIRPGTQPKLKYIV